MEPKINVERIPNTLITKIKINRNMIIYKKFSDSTNNANYIHYTVSNAQREIYFSENKGRKKKYPM